MQETEKIWMNGELVDWADAKVHVGAHGLHYGSGVFEGIRCYETRAARPSSACTTTCERLENSAKVLYMDLPYSVEELRAGDPRADRDERPRRPATCGRSRSTATASSASRRPGTPSTS